MVHLKALWRVISRIVRGTVFWALVVLTSPAWLPVVLLQALAGEVGWTIALAWALPPLPLLVLAFLYEGSMDVNPWTGIAFAWTTLGWLVGWLLQCLGQVFTDELEEVRAEEQVVWERRQRAEQQDGQVSLSSGEREGALSLKE